MIAGEQGRDPTDVWEGRRGLADWRRKLPVNWLDSASVSPLVSASALYFWGSATVKKTRGFTLIELMVVVIIIAVLAAIAIPSYLNQTRKSRRNAAEATLQQISLLEERYRGDHASYLTANTAATWGTLGMADPTGTYYTYAVTATAASGATPAYYTATATAKGDQLKDKAQGTSCTPLTYSLVYDTTNLVLNTVTGPAAVCWSK